MDWKFGPPILVGERVVWIKNSRKPTESGVVRWIGKLSKESEDWTVGVEMDNPLPCGGTDGSWGDRTLFHCNPKKGVFLPLSRIRKETPEVKLKNTYEISEDRHKKWESPDGRENENERECERNSKMTGRAVKELPKWINNYNNEEQASSDIDDLKSDIQTPWTLQQTRNKSTSIHSSPRKKDVRRPFSLVGKISDDLQTKEKYVQEKHESYALEEEYIREFIQREINKHRNYPEESVDEKVKMNGVKGHFKRIDEDDIHNYISSKPPNKYDGYHRKSNGFFSFLKWFKKSKEMPELAAAKDSSVTSSPLFIRRRSSSCGSVDTLFSIATANSFAFVSPVQYQAVISSSHTTYPIPADDEKVNDDKKNKSDYENSAESIKISEVKKDLGTERRKKCKAPDPPARDTSLPSTLEHKKDIEDPQNGHRRTVSESFKDRKAGFYCHVQGKRKAPLPPPTAPLYPSLTSLKSQCSSVKKKRPAPPPPPQEKTKDASKNDNYDNVPFLKNEEVSTQKESVKPLRTNPDIMSSPLPTRPWYKRSSNGSNNIKKESRKNKESEEWMPEVGFSRRPVSNDSGHNLFNLLSRLDKDKKKEEKRKSQISILTNISELDREAAEIVRKEHAQERKLMANRDEKYYSSGHDAALSSFPNVSDPVKSSKNPFDEFKPRDTKPVDVDKSYDANAELDYYINPWNCPVCTLENPGWEKFCEACNMMRGKFRPEKKEEIKQEQLNVEQKDDPAEDNLEGVRQKRLAFFTTKQNVPSEVPSCNSSSEDEQLKLKMMVKEMKNSLPKREKVINKTQKEQSSKDDAINANVEPNKDILCSLDKSGDRDSLKKFPRVQQSWQENKEVEKVEQAEAIIVTKTTVLEDIIVKKKEKVDTSVQTNALARESTTENHAYANIHDAKERSVVDLFASDNTINGDVEAVTAKLQSEGAGSPDYKVNIKAMSASDTLDVNRLLRKLEAAINTGQHVEAAKIAKDLAKMKVSCSVKRQKFGSETSLSKMIVDLYIEDKMTHKGPIQIQILPSITLAQLKMKIEREWNIPRNVQRWILDKQLATNDLKTLEQHGVTKSSCPLFLYIVTPEQPAEETSEDFKNSQESVNRKNGKVMYSEARRPSLIVEEDEGETGEVGTENQNSAVKEETKEDVMSKKRKDKVKLGISESRRKEMVLRENTQISFALEKRELNEDLKKELKVITINSVKDRIEKLNRAATGSAGEGNDPQLSPWKVKGDNRSEPSKQKWHYNELMQLENADLVPNAEEFECPVCLVAYAPGEGVVLKDCLHIFCRTCLVNTIQFNEEAEVKCPYRDNNYSCESVLQEREIKSLVPKGIFEQHLAKSVSVAENNIGNAYHCKTPDCKGWCILEDNANEFRCPVCRKNNCLTCHAIHTGLNCKQYQEQLEFASDTNAEAKKTRDMLQEMVEKGEAMACPTCQVVLMKKWGCDWLRCSMCKTEICWVTRGPRWGPGGKGDTSGGCQCGLNGIKCHPKCNYCH